MKILSTLWAYVCHGDSYLMMVDGDCPLNMMPPNGVSVEDHEHLLPFAEQSRTVVPDHS